MCRGLALGFNWSEGVVCKGLSSHTGTFGNEDKYLKLELMVDDSVSDGYVLEVDPDYGRDDHNQFKECLTKTGSLRKAVRDVVMKWVKRNEVRVLRWLLVNGSHARFKNDQDMSYCKAGNNQNITYCEAGKDQYMSNCEAGNDQCMSGCEAGNDQIMSYCEAGKDQDMCGCKAGRYRYMSFMKCGDMYCNTFINELSNEVIGDLTWRSLVRMAMQCPEEERTKILARNLE